MCYPIAQEHAVQPVIIAITGACIGGGVDLCTAADIRICSADAWFCVKEVDIGLAADVCKEYIQQFSYNNN